MYGKHMEQSLESKEEEQLRPWNRWNPGHYLSIWTDMRKDSGNSIYYYT